MEWMFHGQDVLAYTGVLILIKHTSFIAVTGNSPVGRVAACCAQRRIISPSR